MESIHYDNLQETLYYEVMDNGLHVYVPKPASRKPMRPLQPNMVRWITILRLKASLKLAFLMALRIFLNTKCLRSRKAIFCQVCLERRLGECLY